ncbi:MAG: hypothetical protein ACREYE_31465 [Gammaproteobacteria bacterium]
MLECSEPAIVEGYDDRARKRSLLAQRLRSIIERDYAKALLLVQKPQSPFECGRHHKQLAAELVLSIQRDTVVAEDSDAVCRQALGEPKEAERSRHSEN